MTKLANNRITTSALPSSEEPVYAVPSANLVPVSDHLSRMLPIPASRMFILKNSVKAYQVANPGMPAYDASQGDGGASLPGTPPEILEQAARLQIDQGTAYIMPAGTDAYRRSVIEQYWKLGPGLNMGPANVLAASGGRDALNKAYEAALHLGHGRAGDAVVISRVPWLCYNWGPYMLGANVILAPGLEQDGWSYTEDSITASVKFAAQSGRKIAAIIITSPDNPTGQTLTPQRQAALAKAALKAGIAYVIFDWMYHYVTDESPMDLNSFLKNFTSEERKRLMFLDGLTKSLGASNIRNCHVIADESVIKFIVARASHGVIPPFYSLAVAMAAYEMGYLEAAKTIIEPTNASRLVLKKLLAESGLQHIIGKGYYAFMNVGEFIKAKGWADTEPLGQYLAENNGVAVVPGAFFSPFGGDWVRFSYATPVERTEGAFQRLMEGLESLKK